MKKKFVIFLFLTTVLVLLIGLLVFVQKGKTSFNVEEVLPADPIFYMRLVDLEMNFNDFQKTEFVKKLHTVYFLGTMKALGAQDSELALYEMLGEQVLSQQNIDIFLKLFGREMVVAFYAPEAPDATAWAQESNAFLSRICFAVRLAPEVSLVELFMKTAVRGRSDIQQTSEVYKGEKIYRLIIQDVNVPIVYVRIGDLLIFGTRDIVAKLAVDTVKGDAPSLAQDEVFLGIAGRRIDGAEMSGFFHYELFAKRMKDVVLSMYGGAGKKDDTVIHQQMVQGFQGAEGIRIIYFSGRYDQSIDARVDMLYDQRKMSERIRRIVQDSQMKNHSLVFIPKTAAVYSWNAVFGLQSYLRGLQQIMHQQKTDEAGAKTFLDFSVEDVAEVFTDEMGWYFLDLDVSRVIPIPKGAVFLGVKDMDQARALIRSAVEAQGIWQLKNEKYNGQEIEYMDNVPFFEGLQPSFCVMDDYLMLATHRDVIHQAIDLKNNAADSFINHEAFQKNRADLGNDKAYFFGNLGMLAGDVSAFLKWANQAAAVQDARKKLLKEEAQKRVQEIRQEISQKQEELEDLKGKADSMREEKETLMISPDQVNEVTEEIERKKRFLESAQKAVKSVVEEEQELLAIQENETQQLTEAGLKFLEEVQADVRKKKAREQEIQNEINDLEKRYQDLNDTMQKAQVITLEISAIEKAQEEKQEEITAAMGIQMELEETLKGYERADMPTPKHREIVLSGLVDPFLDVLAQVEWFILKSGVTQERISSELLIEVK